MPPGPSSSAAAVEALLRELPHLALRRADAPREGPGRWPTGLPELDRLLGGGFPCGRLGEIAGPVSSGRTSVALSLLATTTRAGESAALVDAADAFDPESAVAAGVALERALWVRAPGQPEALRSAEVVLRARGFGLVLLDLADGGGPVPDAAWLRLARAAAAVQTSLVVLSTVRRAGPRAELALEMQPARPRFTGTPPLLEHLESEAVVVRNRAGPLHTAATLRFRPAWLPG